MNEYLQSDKLCPLNGNNCANDCAWVIQKDKELYCSFYVIARELDEIMHTLKKIDMSIDVVSELLNQE